MVLKKMPHRAIKNNKKHYDNMLKWIFKFKEGKKYSQEFILLKIINISFCDILCWFKKFRFSYVW